MKNLQNICIAALALSTTMAGCGKKQTQEAKDSVRVEQVKVTRLAKQEIDRELNVSATLEGWEVVNIAPTVQGRIEKLYVDVDSRVKAGQPLVRMDETQYNTTKLAFTNLKVNMDRMEALRKTGSVSQQQYDQTKLSYDQTRDQLAYLERNTFVKAPISGVITAKNYEVGELYAAQPIYTLTQINVLKAIISVPESYLPKIRKGMKIDITTEIYPDQTFPATIDIIYPTINQSTHSFSVKVRINNADEKLRPGMYATTRLNLGKAQAIVVPFQSVLKLQGADDRYVFINDNGTAKRVSVRLGQRFDEKIEIISDSLKEGDELVTTGQARLIKGIKLNVSK